MLIIRQLSNRCPCEKYLHTFYCFSAYMIDNIAVFSALSNLNKNNCNVIVSSAELIYKATLFY